MKSRLGIELLRQVDGNSADFAACLSCLRSPHLFDQAVGFTVLTEPHLRRSVFGFDQNTDVPNLLLNYLLNCIVADLPTKVCEDDYDDYVYDKGGAFLDLRVPLDPYWQRHHCIMSDEDFFKRLNRFLLDNSDVYFDEMPTHVLEAWSPKSEEFGSVMRSWKTVEPLKRYVVDLESILDFEF